MERSYEIIEQGFTQKDFKKGAWKPMSIKSASGGQKRFSIGMQLTYELTHQYPYYCHCYLIREVNYCFHPHHILTNPLGNQNQTSTICTICQIIQQAHIDKSCCGRHILDIFPCETFLLQRVSYKLTPAIVNMLIRHKYQFVTDNGHEYSKSKDYLNSPYL